MTDPELLVAIRRYRAAYYAHWTAEMQHKRDYERAKDAFYARDRSEREDEDFHEQQEARNQAVDEERRRLYREMEDAKYALVEPPPENFSALVREMEEEFGE